MWGAWPGENDIFHDHFRESQGSPENPGLVENQIILYNFQEKSKFTNRLE